MVDTITSVQADAIQQRQIQSRRRVLLRSLPYLWTIHKNHPLFPCTDKVKTKTKKGGAGIRTHLTTLFRPLKEARSQRFSVVAGDTRPLPPALGFEPRRRLGGGVLGP